MLHFIHVFDLFLLCGITTPFLLTAPDVDRNDKPGKKKMPPPPVPAPNIEEGAVITSTNTNKLFKK